MNLISIRFTTHQRHLGNAHTDSDSESEQSETSEDVLYKVRLTSAE